MATRPNWNFSLMGSTNRVQPYCRLAIATIPTIPMSSWSHRRLSMETDDRTAGVDALAIVIPLMSWRLSRPNNYRLHCPCIAYTRAMPPARRDMPDVHIRHLLIPNTSSTATDARYPLGEGMRMALHFPSRE